MGSSEDSRECSSHNAPPPRKAVFRGNNAAERSCLPTQGLCAESLVSRTAGLGKYWGTVKRWDSRSWRDGSVGKVFVSKREDQSSNPQHPQKCWVVIPARWGQTEDGSGGGGVGGSWS